jgi:hypothetical protein
MRIFVSSSSHEYRVMAHRVFSRAAGAVVSSFMGDGSPSHLR